MHHNERSLGFVCRIFFLIINTDFFGSLKTIFIPVLISLRQLIHKKGSEPNFVQQKKLKMGLLAHAFNFLLYCKESFRLKQGICTEAPKGHFFPFFRCQIIAKIHLGNYITQIIAKVICTNFEFFHLANVKIFKFCELPR